MAKKKVLVFLGEKQIKKLDRACNIDERSRSSGIRKACVDYYSKILNDSNKSNSEGGVHDS